MKRKDKLIFKIVEFTRANKKVKGKENKCSEGDCGGDGKHIFKRVKKTS